MVIAWAVVLAVAAVAMAALPLLGLLGFESSLVLAVLVSFAGAHLGARAVAEARQVPVPPSPLSIFARALGTTLLLLAAPLAILAANALRVRNCNLAVGFAWFALLPGLSAVTATAAGLWGGLLVRRWALAGVGIVLASIAWGVWRFYAAPPVFGFDPFVGWFPGSLYDEELSVDTGLLVARGVHLVGVAAALALAAALADPSLRLSLARARRRPLAIALGLVAAWAGARTLAQPRIAPDAASMEKSLGARKETAHLVLLYSPTGPWAREIDLVATDAEFRYDQLAKTLGIAPATKITCWLFDDTASKRRLLGAAHTQIAKPWRREVYIQYDAFPHPVIHHELAHVFAGEWGDPIFHVARRGALFNVGLIEGVAVAAGDRPARLSLDEQVKAMRALGLEPRLSSVLGLGFLGEPPARAYTVAGSFVHFLLERYGAEKFGRVYRAGGSEASFTAAYGKPLATLGAEWSGVIDATPLADRERDVSAERLRRPSVFRKTCAHDMAVRREEARARAAAGDHAGAIGVWQTVCADQPDDVEPLLQITDLKLAADDEAGALAVARSVADHPSASDSQKARALMLIGDRALAHTFSAGGSSVPGAPAAATPDPPEGPARAAAIAAYRRALALHLDDDTTRQLHARMIAAEHPGRFGAALGHYLIGDGTPRDTALDPLRAQQVVDAAPDEGMGHYVLARMLLNHRQWDEAHAEATRAVTLGLPGREFTVAALRIAAGASFHAARYEAAATEFSQLAVEPGADAGTVREATEWIARSRFFARR